jgi:hypothetical protein
MVRSIAAIGPARHCLWRAGDERILALFSRSRSPALATEYTVAVCLHVLHFFAGVTLRDDGAESGLSNKMVSGNLLAHVIN